MLLSWKGATGDAVRHAGPSYGWNAFGNCGCYRASSIGRKVPMDERAGSLLDGYAAASNRVLSDSVGQCSCFARATNSDLPGRRLLQHLSPP